MPGRLMHFTFAAFALVGCQTSIGQISSPGLGIANTASWMAFGVSQQLDTAVKWKSVSYIGIGRKSDPDSYNPFTKASILVINEEMYHRFSKHWQYSGGVSFRTQDIYLETWPYEHDIPGEMHEFRFYSRIIYNYRRGRLKLSPTLRQELRYFWTHPTTEAEKLQLRSRFRIKASVALSSDESRRLILSSEQLFSVDHVEGAHAWNKFAYRESRFSLYYSQTLHSLPLVVSIGYMNDLVNWHYPYSVHYLGFDIILENPFNILSNKTGTENDDIR